MPIAPMILLNMYSPFASLPLFILSSYHCGVLTFQLPLLEPNLSSVEWNPLQSGKPWTEHRAIWFQTNPFYCFHCGSKNMVYIFTFIFVFCCFFFRIAFNLLFYSANFCLFFKVWVKLPSTSLCHLCGSPQTKSVASLSWFHSTILSFWPIF